MAGGRAERQLGSKVASAALSDTALPALGSRGRGAPMNVRHAELLELVRQRGYVSIESMATRFSVSTQTIRRDIQSLCDMKLLERHHGGAGLPPASDALAYTSRKVRNARQKQLIGKRVATEIPNGASLFIDIGTTTEAVAKALVDHRDLRIVTNHIAVAVALSERTDFQITLAGGVVRKRDQAVTGEATVEFLENFKVSFGIFGIGAIDDEGELLDYDYRDVQVSKTAMANARKRFVVMDRTKFNGDAMVRVANISDFDALFTDGEPPPRIREILLASNVRLLTPESR